MDGTFELNVQEHRLQEYLQSNYSLPSDNESSDGWIMRVSFETDHIGNQNEDIISASLDCVDD